MVSRVWIVLSVFAPNLELVATFSAERSQRQDLLKPREPDQRLLVRKEGKEAVDFSSFEFGDPDVENRAGGDSDAHIVGKDGADIKHLNEAAEGEPETSTSTGDAQIVGKDGAGTRNRNDEQTHGRKHDEHTGNQHAGFNFLWYFVGMATGFCLTVTLLIVFLPPEQAGRDPASMPGTIPAEGVEDGAEPPTGEPLDEEAPAATS